MTADTSQTAASITPERPEDAASVERLIALAFGPGRFAKAAERLREGRAPQAGLSFVAWAEGLAVGCVRQWAVQIGGRPALLLGPFAVHPEYRSQRVGATLIAQACEAAQAAGHALILLVGDAPYFEPLGFSAQAAAKIVLPGPVDQRRVLVCALAEGAEIGLEGPVVPA